MRQIFIILALSLVAFAANAQTQRKAYITENENYLKRMAQFQHNPIEKNKIVFLGNSLTQNGKWDEYFPIQKPVNRGIAGDNTDGMLARIDEIIDSRPTKLFIMGGINDISQDKVLDSIICNLETILKEVLIKSPKTKVYIQSVLPINNDYKRYMRLSGKEGKVPELNSKILAMSKKYKVTFINLYPLFLNTKKQLDVKYTNDGLHLNSDGYAVWCKEIRKYIE